MKKRTLAVLLTLLLVISIVPTAAMAKTCEHKEMVWMFSGDTHFLCCKNMDYIDEDSRAPHTYGANGICTVCGDPGNQTLPKETEPEETEPEVTECHHVAKAGTYIRNAFESHTAICEKCGEEFTEHCVFGEDHKCVCGNSNLSYPDATEPEETQPEETKPEESTPSQPSGKDENLDDVPATGDNGAVVIYVSMTVLAMFGAICLLNKKRVV